MDDSWGNLNGPLLADSYDSPSFVQAVQWPQSRHASPSRLSPVKDNVLI